MNNLTKTAKTLDKICHVVQVILKVAAITCAVALVIMLLVPPLFGESIATNLTMIADGILTVFVYNLGDMMNPEVVSHIGMNIEPDLSFLLTFGILRLLSYVFSYGEELQKLSDETV